MYVVRFCQKMSILYRAGTGTKIYVNLRLKKGKNFMNFQKKKLKNTNFASFFTFLPVIWKKIV